MNQPWSTRVDGKTAIVTGGATGIGKAIATALIDGGAKVYICSRSTDVGTATAAEIGAAYVPTDVRSPESVDAAVSAILAKTGIIDILVNCSGGRLGKSLADTTDEEWAEICAVNLSGVFHMCRRVGPEMAERGEGAIVNISSMSALIVNYPQKTAAYNATKAAVVALTRSMAMEWAPDGVRANCVSPGYTVTNMTALSRSKPELMKLWHERIPLNRMAQPEEIAGAALFLASPASSYVTGHNLVVDGGYSVW